MDKFVTRKPKISKTVAEDEETSSSDEASKPRGTKRKFREEWLKHFDWLKEKEGGAFCVACSKTLVNHIGHLKAHEKTATHIQFYESRKKQCTLDNFYNKEHQKQQQQVRNAELTLVMFCIAHNLPFLLMDSLPALLVECCPDSSIAKLIKCGRTKSTEITEYISKQASEQIFSFLRTNCFSLIVDETTDVSMTKSLVLVARYVDAARTVQDRCIALLELTKADAVSIYNVIKQFLCVNNIPFKNLIGLATDGANVMAGDFGGLKALLNKDTGP